MISFRNVKKSFGPKDVLKGVSFDVQDGEVFFIIGASGVGKSVLIKHLIGLLYPDDGEIWLDGEEVSRFDELKMYSVRKKCAMVFQHSTLFDSMTCAENVALPLRKHKGLGAQGCTSGGAALARSSAHGRVCRPLPRRTRRRHAQAGGDRPSPHPGTALRAVRRAPPPAWTQ